MIETWDEKCRRAWCRFHGDKRSKREVAAEFGVKPGTLEAMLARWQVLSRSPLLGDSAERRAAEERARVQDQQEQMRRFRERHAERRAAAARGASA